MAIVVDCVNVDLFLNQDLHELLRVILNCIMERVVAKIILLQTVNAALAEDVADPHHVVKHCRVCATSF